MMENKEYFELAATYAQKALCTHARCGAVVVLSGTVIGAGFNAPPGNNPNNTKCHLDLVGSSKPKSDRTCCVHAEWRALTDALKRTSDITGADLYFIRVDTAGAIQHSRKPYCTVCSRLALDLGVARFGLWHKEGIVMYDTTEYNDLSYQYHTDFTK
jgi:deoxycytidylate deaminase